MDGGLVAGLFILGVVGWLLWKLVKGFVKAMFGDYF